MNEIERINKCLENKNYTEIKPLFQEMAKNPKIYAVYRLIRMPQIRDKFTFNSLYDDKCVLPDPTVSGNNLISIDEECGTKTLDVLVIHVEKGIEYRFLLHINDLSQKLLCYWIAMIREKVKIVREQEKQKKIERDIFYENFSLIKQVLISINKAKSQ